MARGNDVTHEQDWSASTEIRFTSLFLIAAFIIAEAVMEMPISLIFG